MKTIQFTENQQIDFLLGHGLETFLAGKKYTFERDDKADRWVTRGLAFEVPYDASAPVAAGEPLRDLHAEKFAEPVAAAPPVPANDDIAELKRIQEEATKKAAKK